LELRGHGTAIGLDVAPLKIKMGPVLPYNDSTFAGLEVTNSSKNATQLVSLDFDKKIKEEQEMLALYEECINA